MNFKKRKFPTKLWVVGMMFLLFIWACSNNNEGKQETATTNPSTSVSEKKPKKELSMGQKVFFLCQACHNLKKGEPHKVGPNLHGIFGKKAGTAEGFPYSEALKNSDIVWNEKHIRNWLMKPNDYIPGTTMAFVGIEDEAKQTALIEYLKEQTK